MKFQRLITQTITGIAIIGYFVITGCDKQKDDAPVFDNTVSGVIFKDTSFSTLEALVAKANLAIILQGAGPFTVFAPDDSAFARSGITVSFINSLTQDQAQTILLYHTLNSKVLVADLPAGPNAKVTTFNGDSVFVTKNANGVYINGAKILQSDIVADNGVIHKINGVLNPPVGIISQAIVASGLDSLAKAISRATNDTTGDPGLATTLNTATITMFAPTDSAFTKLLTDLALTNIDSIPVGTLVGILNYHITPGLVFSSGLADGPLTMLSGGDAIVNLTNGINGGVTITGSGNAGNASNIILPNIIARNAVLHLVDRVLIP